MWADQRVWFQSDNELNIPIEKMLPLTIHDSDITNDDNKINAIP